MVRCLLSHLIINVFFFSCFWYCWSPPPATLMCHYFYYKFPWFTVIKSYLIYSVKLLLFIKRVFVQYSCYAFLILFNQIKKKKYIELCFGKSFPRCDNYFCWLKKLHFSMPATKLCTLMYLLKCSCKFTTIMVLNAYIKKHK